MLIVDHTRVRGFEEAIRGARNSFASWDKSDSIFENDRCYKIGDADLDLLKRLVSTGCDAESKYARYITVTCDIKAPLYWWKEMDTYKVGTVCNSTSTMHSIAKYEFTEQMFSTEHLWDRSKPLFDDILYRLNEYRKDYLKEENPVIKKELWWQMIQLLPTSFNQLRTMQFNYQNLRNMWLQRRYHKLDEWHQFCDWLDELPYCAALIKCETIKEG